MNGLDLYLVEPRGFCAGVRRAIGIVEDALEKYGAPVFVRHEIVHNKYVIKELEAKGAVFVDEIDKADPARPIIFSAHGVPSEVVDTAAEMGLNYIDATCPLVKKVHTEIKKFYENNVEIIIIGKKDHPEIIGTRGQVPQSKKVHIINSIEDAKALDINNKALVGFVTQTTLSIDDTKDIIECLKSRFENLKTMKKNDICYATTNRQKAIKELVKKAPVIFVIGSKNSSNSRQLREVAMKSGARKAYLIDDKSEVEWDDLKEVESVGISAGASAPEHLVKELVEEFKLRYNNINVHNVIVVEESVNFKS